MTEMAPRIHPNALVESGAEIGAGTEIWDGVHVRAGARIGRGCIVGEKTYVAYDVVVGDLVKINACAYLCAGVRVEDGCMVAAHVVFTNDPTPRATDAAIQALLPSTPTAATAGATVRRGATIGANTTVGPGVEVGTFAMIGMGSVVTHDVPAFALALGNPARVVGLVDRTGTVVHRGEIPPPGTAIACTDGVTLVIDGGGTPGLAEG